MNTDKERLFVAESAAGWLGRLETTTAEEDARFWAWLTESPLHAREMLIAKACDTVLSHALRNGRLDTSRLMRSATNVREIDADHGDAAVTVPSYLVALPAAGGRPFRRSAAVVAFVALLTLTVLGIRAVSKDSIVTAPGEWRTTQLADGTLLQAGPRTKVSIEFTEDERTIRLARGEAMFHVAKDRKRPFVVDAGLANARAIGTAFAVSRLDREGIVVTVQEGVVTVVRRSNPGLTGTVVDSAAGSSIALRAGEQVRVEEVVPLVAQPVEVRNELAWAEGRLVFDTETVAQAAHKFNLRNRLQIEISDPVLAQRAVRGVFRAADPESFATFLADQGLAAIVRDEPDTLLLAAAPRVLDPARGD